MLSLAREEKRFTLTARLKETLSGNAAQKQGILNQGRSGGKGGCWND
jgi:hypothetical protein